MIDLLQHSQGLSALLTAVSYGCLTALALHHGVMYFLFRDKSFMLFSLFALITCLAIFVDNDLAKLNKWSQLSHWAQSALSVTLSLGAAANLLFSRSFLKTQQLAPKTDTALRLLASLFFVMTILLTLSVYFLTVSAWFVGMLFLLILISTGLILYATIQVRHIGHKETYYFLVAQSCILLGAGVSGLSRFDWLPVHSMSTVAVTLGAVFEMLLFSLALSVRTHRDRERSEVALLAVSQARLVLLESIKETEARLESIVRARTKKLEIQLTNEKIHREQHVHFGAMISHEFRNPLGIIESQAALLQREDVVGVNNIKKRINAISSATHRLALLFEKWLQHDRLSCGTNSVRITPIDLSVWITDMSEKCRSYHENHTIELLLSPEAQYIWADEQLLHILLLNLIDNACKYSPNESQVRIETRYRSGQTGIAVIDQGCGIPKQFHEDIFSEYFRVNPTSMVRGVGLGLPFVKRIVSLHSGHIELVSDAGLGSSFCVWLPRQSFPN